MKELKTGIIGCGKVGDFHAKAFDALHQSKFTAVCDHDISRARAFAERYGVKAYNDVETMVRTEGLDVVSVCTPHPLHAAPAVAAANCGCNVLVEKPLAVSLADCDAIIDAVKEAGVVGSMVCQRRFYRPAMRIRKAIQDKGWELMIDSPTNQQFPVVPNDKLAKLNEKYSNCFWNAVGDDHCAVRYCTAWSSRDEDIDALIADIQAV